MKLQQLRYLREVARQGLNVSEAAEALFTSQPGVSKQIRLLEEELGVDVFVRNGKRVVSITAPGQAILALAERMLQDADNLKRVAREFSNEQEGSLTIATTHTQAKYALPPVVTGFMKRYPKIRLSLHQGTPVEICERVIAGEADIAIATEAIDQYPDLVVLPCYQWNRSVLVTPGHPLLKLPSLTLEEIAKYPIITYDYAFAGRSQVNQVFAAKRLEPNIVLSAIDADIIKTYVGLGLGVGIVASMAFDAKRDSNLRALDAGHLFPPATTRIGLRRGSYLRGFAYTFIELFAPQLSKNTVEQAMRGKGSDFEL